MVSFAYDFRPIRPKHESTQAESFRWLSALHARARGETVERAALEQEMLRLFGRVGCSPAAIARRGHELADCTHTRWDEMEIYDVARRPGGATATERTDFYARTVASVFERLYEGEHEAPRDIVHVTCTGYVSPSGAQRLVAKKAWGERTRVTHAYHMGCYAALPALRIATGQALLDAASGSGRIDVVHTELCSLHVDPLATGLDQLVVQTLFADGHLRYSVTREAHPACRGFEVLALREEILPGSTESMGWKSFERGMRMNLDRDVPQRIGEAAPGFVERLVRDAGTLPTSSADPVFAVHPGGPRILDVLQDRLRLAPGQIAHSREVLRRHGNMSSATLPHVWKGILDDPEVAPGSLVVTLAFGPGLTCAGGVLRKVVP